MSLKDFIISKNIKRIRRNVRFHNFETAENIAILYCIQSKSDYEKIKEFAEELSQKGINVNTLAYVVKPDDIGNIYFGQKNNNFFSEKHITKFGKIKETCIKDFINNKTDILINACIKNNFYTKYIFALSKAEFKVSGITGCKYSDLNINISENENSDFFTEQVMYYLNIIKQG